MVDGKIELEGYGEVKANPDQVCIEYGITEQNMDASLAVQVVEQGVKAFFDKLKALGLEEQAEAKDIKSKIQYQNDDMRYGSILGYTVTRCVSVVLTDFSLIPTLNQAAMSCGLTQIFYCRYSLVDSSAYEAEAVHRASNDVKRKADLLAREFGLALGKPRSLSFSKATPFEAACYLGRANQPEELIVPDCTAIYRPAPITIGMTIHAEYVYQH